jgi:heme/copper-type cytochrome/quinol oxidase subunit 2
VITEPFKPVRGVGVAASVLIGLAAVVAIADALSSQHSANVVREYTEGNGTMEDLRAADAISLLVNGPGLLVLIAAGVVFIVWLYRSRQNAERLTYDVDHRHKRGWVIGGWFVPVISLWYPGQIVQDVWRSFNPAQQDRPLQARDKSGLVVAWWLVYLLSSWGDRAVTQLVLRDSDLDTIAAWTWVCAVLTTGAAVLAIVLIRRLTDLQHVSRPPVQDGGPVQVHVPGA